MRFLVGLMMVAFLFGGLGLLYSFGRELVLRIRRRPHLIQVDGVVMRVHTKTSTSTASGRMRITKMHFPVIRFTTQAGETVTFKSEMGDGGDSSRYRPGQKLPIFYDPDGRLSPMIASWSGVWLPNLMGLVGGLAFVGASALIYWAFWDKIIGAA